MKKITTVLFDLDGTLLPMDQDMFIKAYLGGLVKVAAPLGYDPSALAKSIMAGTYVMYKNDGSKTNEDAFWLYMESVFGKKIIEDKHIFDEYYRTDFQKVAEVCGNTPDANQVVKQVKGKGLRVTLATNPLFPRMATESRARWAGLDTEDFEIITTFEDYTHCKPNLDYYRDILANMGVEPEECLMVGNDVSDDMVARNVGLSVFLLTPCLINKDNLDVSSYPSGDLHALTDYIADLVRK